MPPADKPAKPAPAPATTEFVVLFQQAPPLEGAPASWSEVGRFNTRDKETAYRQAMQQLGVGEGEFVAVPARSWQPQKARTEQTTRVVFGSTPP
jgi:hypothetical protein